MADTFRRGGSRQKSIFQVRGTPLIGGAITDRHKGLLNPGQFSAAQNIRQGNPGIGKRAGYSPQHTTADSTNDVTGLFNFSRPGYSENHLLALMSDGDILDATNLPPSTTTGNFGSEIWSGTTSPKHPSWSNMNDTLLFSNKVDQHQFWKGDRTKVGGFVVYKTATNPSTVKGIIENGEDYTLQVTDDQSTTVAILDDLDTAANGDGFFVYSHVPFKDLTLTVAAANGNTATLAGYYWKNDSTWSALTVGADGTSASGKTLAQTGTISITEPTDIQDKYLFGKVGYWYLFVVSAALSSEVEISEAVYSASFAPLKNLWDGDPTFAVEVQVEGTSQWETYAGSSVDVDALAVGNKIVMAFTDPVEAIYIDVNAVPNATGTSIASLKYWNGSAFTTVGTPVDGTSGLSNSGWICFPRQTAVQPLQFESSQYYAYWYELIFDAELSASMVISILGASYFNISDFGNIGICSSAWKNRGIFSFDKYPEYVYISADGNPQVLASGDTGIIELGDGRSHKAAAMRPFFNELMVWQEEHGSQGGTITLIQGYNRATFGKLILSTDLGTMNAQSVDVVENFLLKTTTDESIKLAAFCLSRNGVYICDGQKIAYIDWDIKNYFDPKKSACIRRGYEDKMWLKYDPSDRVIRLGLVSGSTATNCNVWPVFDLETSTWSFDDYADAMGCLENVGTNTGNTPVAQVSGGIGDGTVYIMNSGLNDNGEAINSYIDLELHNGGEWILLEWLSLTYETQSAGNITLITYENGIQKDSLTFPMQVEITNQIIRRHLQSLNAKSPHITIRIQHNTASQAMELQHLGLEVYAWDRR